MNKTSEEKILEAIFGIEREVKGIKNEVMDIKRTISVIPEMQEQLKVIPKMQEQLKVIPEMQEQLKVIPKMQEQLNEIPEMKKDIKQISKTVAVIEVEHGKKLGLALDAISMHSEKFEFQQKRIENGEKIMDRNSDKIYYLENKLKQN